MSLLYTLPAYVAEDIHVLVRKLPLLAKICCCFPILYLYFSHLQSLSMPSLSLVPHPVQVKRNYFELM